MKYQVVLVHRDGDTKTCLGESRDSAIALAVRVQEKFRDAYVAAFLPDAKNQADACYQECMKEAKKGFMKMTYEGFLSSEACEHLYRMGFKVLRKSQSGFGILISWE